MKKHVITKESCCFIHEITIASSTIGKKRLYLALKIEDPDIHAYRVKVDNEERSFRFLDDAIAAYNEI